MKQWKPKMPEMTQDDIDEAVHLWDDTKTAISERTAQKFYPLSHEFPITPIDK